MKAYTPYRRSNNTSSRRSDYSVAHHLLKKGWESSWDIKEHEEFVIELVYLATFHGDLPKSFVVPVEGPKCSGMCCSCTAQGSRKKGRSGIEMLELQVCCGAELCDIFMLMQCLCRCVGDVWWLRELAWAWKALQIHQFPSKSKVVQYICCSSDCKATLQSISKPLSPEDKGSDLIMVHMKISHICGLPPRTGMVSSNVSCGLFVTYISGPQLAGLGVFANFSTHLLSWDWRSSFPLLLLVLGSSIKIWWKNIHWLTVDLAWMCRDLQLVVIGKLLEGGNGWFVSV